MGRRWKIAVLVLVVLVIAGAIYLPRLYHRAVGLERNPTSEQAERHAIIEPPVSTPSDVETKARMFWASPASPGKLQETDVEMKLSANPVERGKQLIAALIANPPSPESRTLPAGTSLEEFYLLPGGVAVADFSSELSTEMPSGIQSELLAVDSISDTLAANIPNLRRLKILIDGHEAKTLAGHIDLTGYFRLQAPPSALSAANGSATPH
jgi:hypothetical protein